jgi:hypothetical protein
MWDAWDMPIALTDEEARHARNTGAPLKRLD